MARSRLADFDTDGSSNGSTEAINGLIELHRRIARGFRNLNHYRLSMLLIGGGLTHPRLAVTHLRSEEPSKHDAVYEALARPVPTTVPGAPSAIAV